MPFAMQGDDEWPVSSGLVGQEEQMIHVIDQRMLRLDLVRPRYHSASRLEAPKVTRAGSILTHLKIEKHP